MIGEQARQKRLRIAALIAFAVLGTVIVISFVATVLIYEKTFGQRFETYEPLSLSVTDFDGLQVRECRFPSDKGQMLAGSFYFKDGSMPRGLLVIAHGFGGGGHNSYMNVADFFASNGFLVFAYDATGNDQSEGTSVKGLPQGIIDLDHALQYLGTLEEVQDLPVVLFGHSWGGYSVSGVLNLHPEVRAVVSVAGFNVSSDLIEAQGQNMIGPAIHVVMPFLAFWEHLRFGRLCELSAIDGFSSSEARVMIIHSEDDKTVPPCYGLDLYEKEFDSDERFTFITYPDRGHNRLYYSDAARAYFESFNEEFAEYFGHADKVDPEERAAYLHEHLDKARLYELDDKLFARILDFYIEAISD